MIDGGAMGERENTIAHIKKKGVDVLSRGDAGRVPSGYAGEVFRVLQELVNDLTNELHIPEVANDG